MMQEQHPIDLIVRLFNDPLSKEEVEALIDHLMTGCRSCFQLIEKEGASHIAEGTPDPDRLYAIISQISNLKGTILALEPDEELISAYAEALVTYGEAYVQEKFPILTLHLGVCELHRKEVETTCAFIRETNADTNPNNEDKQ